MDRGFKVWPMAELNGQSGLKPEEAPRKQQIFGGFFSRSQESDKRYLNLPFGSSMCLSRGCADICCVTGGIIVILGTFSAISGIFPKNQVSGYSHAASDQVETDSTLMNYSSN